MDKAIHMDNEVEHYHKWMKERTELDAISRQNAWLELKGGMKNGNVIPDRYMGLMQVIKEHGKKHKLSQEDRAKKARELAQHFRRRFV